MSFMRFSAAPAGRLSDRTIPWAIFGERPDVPDGLEDSALAGASLAQIASTPGAPMFEPESLFGAHMAAQGLDLGMEDEAPVVVFVHGYQHEPRRPILARARSDNPHRCLYHFDETPGGPGSAEERRLHTTPWFARAMLPEGRGGPELCEGVAIGYSYASWGGSADPFMPGYWTRLSTALGMKARFTPPDQPYVNAYRDAEMAGFGLAAIVTQLRARLDDAGHVEKRIDLFCHSLGARTVLSAIALIAQRWPNDATITRIGRVILLGGACYWGQAAFALANLVFSEAPHLPQFYNVTSQSDDVLRYLATRKTPREARLEAEEDLSLTWPDTRLLLRGRTIGRHGKPPHGLYRFFGPEYPHWVDIALDSGRVQRWGRKHGFHLTGRPRLSLGDHWVYYTHPGNWGLYRAILNRRSGFAVADVTHTLGQ